MISKNFSIEEIRNIRYENYEQTKNFSHKEIIEKTRKDAEYGINFLLSLKHKSNS